MSQLKYQAKRLRKQFRDTRRGMTHSFKEHSTAVRKNLKTLKKEQAAYRNNSWKAMHGELGYKVKYLPGIIALAFPYFVGHCTVSFHYAMVQIAAWLFNSK